jgi:hypothetical protein
MLAVIAHYRGQFDEAIKWSRHEARNRADHVSKRPTRRSPLLDSGCQGRFGGIRCAQGCKGLSAGPWPRIIAGRVWMPCLRGRGTCTSWAHGRGCCSRAGGRDGRCERVPLRLLSAFVPDLGWHCVGLCPELDACGKTSPNSDSTGRRVALLHRTATRPVLLTENARFIRDLGREWSERILCFANIRSPRNRLTESGDG